MTNELILIINLIVTYGLVLVFYKLFKKEGLFAWLIIATLAANLEVHAQICAFGLQQTLGNILFASTFLATDILSEYHSKEDASRAVHISIFICIAFIIISQFWLYFIPGKDDFALEYLQNLSKNTPRIMFSGLLVFAITEKLDIWLYHKLWNWKGNSTHQFLWLRNNGATIISQAINAILFNLLAFYGTFPTDTLWEIIATTFIIYLFTSLLDTPYIYLAKKINN